MRLVILLFPLLGLVATVDYDFWRAYRMYDLKKNTLEERAHFAQVAKNLSEQGKNTPGILLRYYYAADNGVEIHYAAKDFDRVIEEYALAKNSTHPNRPIHPIPYISYMPFDEKLSEKVVKFAKKQLERDGAVPEFTVWNPFKGVKVFKPEDIKKLDPTL